MFLAMQSPQVALTSWSKAQLSLVYLATDHQNLVSTASKTGLDLWWYTQCTSVNCEPPQSVNDACGRK